MYNFVARFTAISAVVLPFIFKGAIYLTLPRAKRIASSTNHFALFGERPSPGLCPRGNEQSQQDSNLENLEGVVGIADDVCVVGRTKEEQDRNLIATMDRAMTKGLVFKSSKCLIKQKNRIFQ